MVVYQMVITAIEKIKMKKTGLLVGTTDRVLTIYIELLGKGMLK